MIIKGLKINYKILGEGKPLLILHGWGSRSDNWQKVGELLSVKGIRVIIPDLPGFGKSQEPQKAWSLDDYCDFIEEFIKTLNLERFYLLGHSFSGALALKLSLRMPEKVEKLFLVAASFQRRKKLKKRFFWVLAKIGNIFSFLPFYSYLRKGFYRFLVKSDYPSTEGVMRQSYLRIIKQDLSDILEKIEVSTTIIWGEEDDITPLKYGHLINRMIKGSRIEIIPNAGHDLNIKCPEELAKAILI